MSKRDELLDYLKAECEGKSRAKSGRALTQTLHIGKSELQRHINRLRRDRKPIGSCQQGYFYAVTATEVYTTIRQLQQMERGLQAAIGGLEGTLEEFTGGNTP